MYTCWGRKGKKERIIIVAAESASTRGKHGERWRRQAENLAGMWICR